MRVCNRYGAVPLMASDSLFAIGLAKSGYAKWWAAIATDPQNLPDRYPTQYQPILLPNRKIGRACYDHA